MINDNPVTAWKILAKVEGNFVTPTYKQPVTFNETLTSATFHMYRTRKWARKMARENYQDLDLYVFRVIIPVGAIFDRTKDNLEVFSNQIIIKNDKIYTP